LQNYNFIWEYFKPFQSKINQQGDALYKPTLLTEFCDKRPIKSNS